MLIHGIGISMLQHEGNTQGICRSILGRMPRHWNIYEKRRPQHAIADAFSMRLRKTIGCENTHDGCRNIHGSMPQHAGHMQAGCQCPILYRLLMQF